AKPRIPELQRECQIGPKYRVDFLIPDQNVVIELYGYKYHNTKEKLTSDAERERELQRRGYRIIRFTGSEITKDVDRCVEEVLSIVRQLPTGSSNSHPSVADRPPILEVHPVELLPPDAAKPQGHSPRSPSPSLRPPGLTSRQLLVLAVMATLTMGVMLALVATVLATTF
ncbi:MAG TPA: DUF559 domain-containing protein, partial [Anaerolineales bacterium]|nr:DUF559 domain-containing protein [Anaerolineales bacterium]